MSIDYDMSITTKDPLWRRQDIPLLHIMQWATVKWRLIGQRMHARTDEYPMLIDQKLTASEKFN